MQNIVKPRKSDPVHSFLNLALYSGTNGNFIQVVFSKIHFVVHYSALASCVSWKRPQNVGRSVTVLTHGN